MVIVQYAATLALLLSGVIAAEEPRLVELKLPSHFDPFAAGAKGRYAEAARVACAAPKPAKFVGYRWRLPAFAAELRHKSGESEGKQIYVAFLKTKYGYRIAELNADYGTEAQSFTELLESPMTVVDESREKVRRDDAEFDSSIKREVVNDIVAALGECDAAHASGGIRLLLEIVAGH